MSVKRIFLAMFACLPAMLLVCCASYEKYPISGLGTASWYGAEFHGKPTSSGEIFDMNALTCAHREYAFGTKVKVTSASNGRSVQCVINDRGPFVQGRDIDLSYAAAKEIGLIGTGTGRVLIEYMGRDTSYVRDVKYETDRGPFTIQIGSFSEPSNASRLKESLELKYGGVYVRQADIGGKTFFRVRIGRFARKEDLSPIAGELADEGYGVFVTRYDGSDLLIDSR